MKKLLLVASILTINFPVFCAESNPTLTDEELRTMLAGTIKLIDRNEEVLLINTPINPTTEDSYVVVDKEDEKEVIEPICFNDPKDAAVVFVGAQVQEGNYCVTENGNFKPVTKESDK